MRIILFPFYAIFIRIEKNENKELKELTSKLIIENVRRNDTNIYTCIAVNKYGSDESQINLIVQGICQIISQCDCLNAK
jgi:hypothetical protein